MHPCHSQAIWLYLLYHKFFWISANLRGADRLHFITSPNIKYFSSQKREWSFFLSVSFIHEFWFIIHSDSTKRMTLFLCQTMAFHKNVSEKEKWRENSEGEDALLDKYYHCSLQSEKIMQFKFLQKTYLFILNIQVDNFNFHLHC